MHTLAYKWKMKAKVSKEMNISLNRSECVHENVGGGGGGGRVAEKFVNNDFIQVPLKLTAKEEPIH